MEEIRSKEESIELFKELEEECKSSPLLVYNVDKSDIKLEHKDYKEFILDFINNINLKDIYTATVKGSEQTSRNRKRSLGDLYRLTISYFPDTDIVDLAIFLTEQNLAGNIDQVRLCPTIHKIVFHPVHYTGENKHTMEDRYTYDNDYGIADTHKFHTTDNLYHDDYLNLLK